MTGGQLSGMVLAYGVVLGSMDSEQLVQQHIFSRQTNVRRGNWLTDGPGKSGA